MRLNVVLDNFGGKFVKVLFNPVMDTMQERVYHTAGVVGCVNVCK